MNNGTLIEIVILAMIALFLVWKLGSVLGRRTGHERQHPDSMVASGMSMIAGGFALILTAAALGEFAAFQPAETTTKSWLAVLYLATFGTAAFNAFIWLMRATTAARASSYSYVNPVVAVILGWALGGETITGRTIIAMAVIVSAVWLIVAAKTAPRKIETTAEREIA